MLTTSTCSFRIENSVLKELH